jgi:hypothetical protein
MEKVILEKWQNIESVSQKEKEKLWKEAKEILG